MELALNTYSLRAEMDAMGDKRWEIITAFCHDLGISQIEIMSSHLEGYDQKTVINQLANNGIKVFAIATSTQLVDIPEKVDEEIEDGKYWIENVSSFGIKYLKFQVGNGPFKPLMQPMDDFDEDEWQEYMCLVNEGLEVFQSITTPLVEAAEAADVYIGIETHWGFSANYLFMQAVNNAYPSSHLGWIYDAGNYENDTMRWRGLEQIKTRTYYLHAKMYAFDDQGFEKTLDYPRICQTLGDASFNGNYSIEFEGKMHGFLGVSRAAELIRYCIAQSKGTSYVMKTDFPSGEAYSTKIFGFDLIFFMMLRVISHAN